MPAEGAGGGSEQACVQAIPAIGRSESCPCSSSRRKSSLSLALALSPPPCFSPSLSLSSVRKRCLLSCRRMSTSRRGTMSRDGGEASLTPLSTFASSFSLHRTAGRRAPSSRSKECGGRCKCDLGREMERSRRKGLSGGVSTATQREVQYRDSSCSEERRAQGLFLLQLALYCNSLSTATTISLLQLSFHCNYYLSTVTLSMTLSHATCAPFARQKGG